MLQQEGLSPWWRRAVILVLIFGFTILIGMAVAAYRAAPPIPAKAVGPSGETVFTREDVKSGQQVFLKYGLMENGTIWGHGAYLGPDFSADYLHTLAIHAAENAARTLWGKEQASLNPVERGAVDAHVRQTLKQNRYDPATDTLTLSAAETESFERQQAKWTEYFHKPAASAGLPEKYLTDADELRHLTAFFAWTAWASSVARPGKKFSYTNNFPYDPAAGNEPSSDAILWSALSLIALLGGTALVLFAFGKFNYLGWTTEDDHGRLRLMPGAVTESQKSTIKYFVVVGLLFLAQTLVGAATAHYRADPTGFFGIDISTLFPSHIMRTWHLQLAIFWIAMAYVAGGLFLAPMLGGKDPPGQSAGTHILFVAMVIVTVGSLLGEIFGINNLLGKLWFWFGHQGWEYLDLGRVWQMLLAVGLVFWLVLLFRAVAPARKDPERGEISSLFLYAAVAIPIFYLPAMFFGGRTHFTIVDMWRFWIIHLWVEGFFELFVTVMVAVIFFRLGIISRITACRVVYLDAILYLGSGIVGTGHHWYWTGQSNVTMALAAVFSALEVVPLTLLTLDAWDFVQVTRAHSDESAQALVMPHKWTFYYLMSVGFWNFLGAGVFGFLINMPVVSYFEVGTLLTPNHGHAAMMGVFGMLAVALMVFALRQALADDQWKRVEKYVRVSFWGLNVGLLLMVAVNLFPGGVLQLRDVLQNGYWHARSPEFLTQPFMKRIEWLRMPADLVFIFLGVVPLAVAGTMTYGMMRMRKTC
jgi:nitric oxide reductase subunit B